MSTSAAPSPGQAALFGPDQLDERHPPREEGRPPCEENFSSAGDQWSEVALATHALTSEQEQAVARRSGPLLLAAGAGSGKTSVLVERFVRAVREDGIAPARILAITFTERAAGELRARVRARLLELGEREAARDTEGAQIGTFHGFCARLLRVHALLVELDPDFVILDHAGAVRLEALAFRRALATLVSEEHEEGRRADAVDLVAAYGADRLRAMLLGLYAEQRSRGIDAPTLPLAALTTRVREEPETSEDDRRALLACTFLDETLRGFAQHYADLKRARGALDFDDLELRARTLLSEHDGVREAWSERLELMMVDEFQDTNRRQLALLELLDRGNLFTVGDELQSIYGFRYAEVELFRERRGALAEQGAALALTESFRARPPLIAAVNAVFATRFGEAHRPLLAARDESDRREPSVELLLTDRRGWAESPHARALAGELPPAPLWRQAEARLLAQRVAELVQAGDAAAGEIVVLLRAAGDLAVYERALQERGLRTLAAVGSFWGHQQVGDLLAWLRALANPLDEVALYSTLASPLVGLSSDGLALLALRARRGRAGVWAMIKVADEELDTQLSPADRERLGRFVELFTCERRLAATHGVAELLLRAIAACDYERHVLTLDWAERRLANVHKLLRLARRFEATEGRSLSGFLEHVTHLGTFAQGAEPEAPTGGAEPDAVRLMTIHAAKGLEFPVVCVADLGRTGQGLAPDLLLDGERVGLRLASLDGSPSRGCLQYEELSAERCLAEAAEEERIVYVAMTRARERLLLSGAVDFANWPAARAGGAPIAWLAPALAADVSASVLTLEHAVLDQTIAVPPEGAQTIRVNPHSGPRIRCWLNAPATVGEVLRIARSCPTDAIPAGTGTAMLET
jgi:ATP-dependent exoDNAse (exonuclease V) beta subunit